MHPELIHLAASFDQNYLTPFYVLITSIFDNNRETLFHIHTIVTGVSDQEKEEMQQFVRQHNSNISFYEIAPEDIEGLIIPEQSYFTLATYYRLFFPLMVPETVKKLLYLDTDIVVVGDLSEIYHINITGFPVGAVAEVNATKNRPDLGIDEIGAYFNAGVMLMNISEWKDQKISERAIQFLHDFPEKIVWVDQDALNVVLKDNYVKLSAKFNVTPFDIPRYLPKSGYHNFLKGKIIIHYALREHKPWHLDSSNKFRYLYHDYLKQSPRFNEKRYKKFQFTTSAIKRLVRIRVSEALINFPLVPNIISVLTGKDVSSQL